MTSVRSSVLVLSSNSFVRSPLSSAPSRFKAAEHVEKERGRERTLSGRSRSGLGKEVSVSVGLGLSLSLSLGHGHGHGHGLWDKIVVQETSNTLFFSSLSLLDCSTAPHRMAWHKNLSALTRVSNHMDSAVHTYGLKKVMKTREIISSHFMHIFRELMTLNEK